LRSHAAGGGTRIVLWQPEQDKNGPDGHLPNSGLSAALNTARDPEYRSCPGEENPAALWPYRLLCPEKGGVMRPDAGSGRARYRRGEEGFHRPHGRRATGDFIPPLALQREAQALEKPGLPVAKG